MPVSADDFKRGMRRLAAAVSVITTATENQRGGMTATAVTSLTADPPQIGVVINKTASSFPLIVEARRFAVNVLAKDQVEIGDVFSGFGGIKGEDRFGYGQWATAVTGAPVLVGATATFDCRSRQQLDLGTHVMFVGLIEEIVTAAHNRPLLYLDGGWASLVRASEGEVHAYREAMRETVGIIDQAIDEGDDPSVQLRRFVQDFARINLEQIETTRSFFGHEAYAPAAELVEINAMKNEFDRKLKELLRRGVEAKAVTIEDPQMAALAMTGMMLWMHRWYKDSGRLRNEEIERQFAAMALTMIGLKDARGGQLQ
jgi:flavin reductase (DIM6/NTAB) family NADH-FMN oxidoreductase RutF